VVGADEGERKKEQTRSCFSVPHWRQGGDGLDKRVLVFRCLIGDKGVMELDKRVLVFRCLIGDKGVMELDK